MRGWALSCQARRQKGAAMRFKFKAKYLPILAKFAAKQDIRYYLNGFRVEAAEIGGVYLVATNGHAMLVIHDADGMVIEPDHNVAAIRITPGLVAASKPSRLSRIDQFVIMDGKRLSVAPDFGLEHSDNELFVQGGNPIVLGKYPIWRKAIPDFSQLKPGALVDGNDVSLDYLSMFNLGGSRYTGSTVSLWHSGAPGSAIVVQCLGTPEAVGIVMPARGDNKADQLERLAAKMPKKIS